jgi:hypothetical protein
MFVRDARHAAEVNKASRHYDNYLHQAQLAAARYGGVWVLTLVRRVEFLTFSLDSTASAFALVVLLCVLYVATVPLVLAIDGVALVLTLALRPSETCRSASEGARNERAWSGVEDTRRVLPRFETEREELE